MSENEFRAFAFTIRPRDGCKPNGVIETKLIKYLGKHRGFIVAEKYDNERHLHGVIYFLKPKRKYDIQIILKGMQEAEQGNELDYQELRVLKGGVKIAYNDDFYTEYTNKPDSQLIYDNLPDDTQEFYPSKDEQERVKNRSNAVDKTYHSLLELWNSQERTDITEKNVKCFLYEQMYVKKTIKVIEDKKKFNQRCISLFHYIMGEFNDTSIEFLFGEK